MQQVSGSTWVRVFRPLALIILLVSLGLSGCGGGNKDTKAGVPTSISFSPSSLSLRVGGVQGLSAQVLDGNGNAIATATVTFSSANPSIASVSSSGLVCAGTWDSTTTPIVCTPGSVGSTQITISSGSLSANVPTFTHQKVDAIRVTPARVDCRSVGQTQQMTAQAFSNGVDITNTVGPFAWATQATSIATVDSSGVVTAVRPGATNVAASVSGVSSVPAVFITCAVKTIRVHVSGGSDAAFTLNTSGTQQLVADVVDTAGVTITPTLTWNTSQPVVATVNTSGLVTGTAAGTSGITASCLFPCNSGLGSIYSNVAVASVNGSSATTVYVTGTGTTSLVPIDTSTNSAGTAITLPATPNSFVFSRQGTAAYLGSTGGLITLNPTNNAVTNNSSAPGIVLAVSPDGNRVLVAGSSSVFALVSGAVETLNITGATAAEFSPDNSKAYIVAGSTLYVYQSGATLRSIPLATPASDVAFLASGAFAYLAGGAASAASVVANCNNVLVATPGTGGTPRFIRPLPDGSGMLTADSPGLDVIISNTDLAGCPPALSHSEVFKDFLQGSFTARQLIVLPNGAKAYITSDLGKLLAYDVAAGTAATIDLGGAAAFTGGATLDSSRLYLGASDNAVHRIDVAGGTDAQQIPVSFTPDLVAVRPK